MKILPTKNDWNRWTLPSKYSALGLMVGVIGVALAVYSYVSDRSDIRNKNRAQIEAHKEKFQVMVGMEMNFIDDFLYNANKLNKIVLEDAKQEGRAYSCKQLDIVVIETAFESMKKRKAGLIQHRDETTSIDIDSVKPFEMQKHVADLIVNLNIPMKTIKKYSSLSANTRACISDLERYKR